MYPNCNNLFRGGENQGFLSGYTFRLNVLLSVGEATKDLRAKALQNYIRYGTNSQFEILLTRYGFDFEDSDWLISCIDDISEDSIDFNQGIYSLSKEQYELIERYL